MLGGTFDNFLNVFKREAMASIAIEMWEWVEKEKGRKIIIEWENEYIRIKRINVDGKKE